MKTTTSLLTTAAVLASLGSAVAGETPSAKAPVVAPPSGIESTFHAGYASDYIYRGNRRGDDIYSFGLDFSGDAAVPVLGDLDLSAGIWYGSFEYDTRWQDSSMNELRLFGEVSKSVAEMFTVSAGVTNYSYFGNGGATDDDVEPYLAVAASVMGINLGAAAYFDGSNNYTHDLYYEFTAGYETALPIDRLSGGIELVLGVFDESNVNPSDDSDIYFGGTASLHYAVSDSITVSPFVSVTFSDNLGDYFFGGANVSFDF